MSNPKKHDNDPRPVAEAAAESAAAEPLDRPEPADDATTAEAVTRLEAEKADLKDRLLRTLADLENMRRRSERELADARSYAISKFAGDMLEVADNMGRAIAAIPDEARSSADAALKALVAGAELTEREMLRALEKHGVKRIDPKGERFDPNLHQAIFEVPDPSLVAGTVAQVVQVGYSIADRVLRPALVGVAKGGPKAGASGPNGQGASAAGSSSEGSPAQGASGEAGASVDKTA
jgi:molecular chaperone GrpE